MVVLRRPGFFRRLAKVVACLWLIGAGQASALDYPARPVTIVVPFPAGGPSDAVVRLVAESMRTPLGQRIVIENVTGAGGAIGVGRVARAMPDGYTLGFGFWNTHVVNGAIYALPYDVLNDFEPIALIANNATIIVAGKAHPANDLAALIAWLKANPGKASWGTQGVGGPSHMGGIFFQNVTGARVQFVPYRGIAFALQDLVAGQIDLSLLPLEAALPQLRAGAIKAYAVTSRSRLAGAPEIPTVDEAGLPGFYFSIWTGLWAPKATPKDIIEKINGAVVTALADPAVDRRLTDIGFEVFPREQQTPAALGALQRAEIEKWWPIIKAAGIKAE
jgi:tripartite-type tricarboxylate transporter receptor subunit TctC